VSRQPTTLIFDIGGEALRRNITANIKCAQAHFLLPTKTTKFLS